MKYEDYLETVIKTIRTYDSNEVLAFPSGKLEWTIGLNKPFTIKVDEDEIVLSFVGKEIVQATVFDNELVIESSRKIKGGIVKINGVFEGNEILIKNLFLEILQSLVETNLLGKIKLIK